MKAFIEKLSNDNVTLTCYIHDQSREMPNRDKRCAVLVIPGGGYHMCSDREADPVAMKFLSNGYSAFVLRYSVGRGSPFPKPLDDAREALKMMRERADEWHIYPDRIAAIGFSAGGHLTAALSTISDIRPDAQILGYPCILEKMSDILAAPIPGVDKYVDGKTPPAFIFHSTEDSVVPIKNSLTYAQKLDENNIPFEMHLFAKGYHGFSTSEPEVFTKKEDYEYNKDCAQWVPLCITWLNKLFKGDNE